MSSCNPFSVNFSGSSQDLFNKVSSLIHQHNGTITGSPTGGTFSVPIPVFGVVAGTFDVSGQTCKIHVTQRSVEQFGAVENKLAELSPLIKHIELEPTCVEFVATFHIICDLAFATTVYTITRSHWLESAQQ